MSKISCSENDIVKENIVFWLRIGRLQGRIYRQLSQFIQTHYASSVVPVNLESFFDFTQRSELPILILGQTDLSTMDQLRSSQAKILNRLVSGQRAIIIHLVSSERLIFNSLTHMKNYFPLTFPCLESEIAEVFKQIEEFKSSSSESKWPGGKRSALPMR